MTQVFERLLDVQAKDTEADQLRHRRATLPERGEVTSERSAVAGIEAGVTDLAGPLHDLEREQKRLEDELAGVEAKIAKEDARLYDGTVSAIKELQAIQDEIAALRRRQDDLETAVLEVLDAMEPLGAQLDELSARRSVHESAIERLLGAIAAAEAEIDGELARIAAERAESAEHVPAELLAEYEQLRAGRDGVGVARLISGSCGGCHLGLSAVELDRIKRAPPDAVVHCEECGRILVR